MSLVNLMVYKESAHVSIYMTTLELLSSSGGYSLSNVIFITVRQDNCNVLLTRERQSPRRHNDSIHVKSVHFGHVHS